MGNLAGWPWWKVISITGQAGSGTDYQVKFTIGDSAGGNVHLEGHCTNFPQDIRITDDDGTTLLDHFVEDLTADPIVVRVKVDDNLDSNQDIRVYYGKSGESTASNVTNTMIFGDNLSTLDAGKWPTRESGYEIVTNHLHTKDVSDSDLLSSQLSGRSSSSEEIIELRMKSTTQELNYNEFTFGIGDAAGRPDTANRFGIRNYRSSSQNLLNCDYNGSWEIDGAYVQTLGTWYGIQLIKTTSTLYWKIYNDGFGSLLDSASISNSFSSDNLHLFGHLRASYPYKDAYIDWVIVRKYNSPEPAFSSAGAEQSAAGVPTGVFYGPLIGPFGGPI